MSANNARVKVCRGATETRKHSPKRPATACLQDSHAIHENAYRFPTRKREKSETESRTLVVAKEPSKTSPQGKPSSRSFFLLEGERAQKSFRDKMDSRAAPSN